MSCGVVSVLCGMYLEAVVSCAHGTDACEVVRVSMVLS